MLAPGTHVHTSLEIPRLPVQCQCRWQWQPLWGQTCKPMPKSWPQTPPAHPAGRSLPEAQQRRWVWVSLGLRSGLGCWWACASWWRCSGLRSEPTRAWPPVSGSTQSCLGPVSIGLCGLRQLVVGTLTPQKCRGGVSVLKAPCVLNSSLPLTLSTFLPSQWRKRKITIFGYHAIPPGFLLAGLLFILKLNSDILESGQPSHIPWCYFLQTFAHFLFW